MNTLLQRYRQFIRFLIVGIVNTIFGYGIYAALLYAGLHFAWAGMLSTIAGILFNFKTIGAGVFGSRRSALIFPFALVYGINYCFSIAGIALLGIAGMSPYIGGAIMLLPAALLSFVLNKNFVFNK